MSFELDAGVFRALSREEAPLANALADSIKPTFSHWDEDYPTLELFEQDAVAGELFGYFIDNKLVSIIVATTAPEEFEDVLGVPGANWPDSKRPCMLCRLCVDVNDRRRVSSESVQFFAKKNPAFRETLPCNSYAFTR